MFGDLARWWFRLENQGLKLFNNVEHIKNPAGLISK